MDVPLLSAEQLDQYHREGWTVLPGLLGPEEVTAIGAEVDQLVDHQPTHTPAGWVFGLHNQDDLCQRVARDPRLVERVGQVVGPGVSIHSSKLVTKLAQDPVECNWHQDEAFYSDTDDVAMLSDCRMSIWIPLQDVDEDNGCLHIVPGSHQWGLDPYELVGEGHCRRQVLRTELAEERAIPVPLSAGDCLLFSAYLWHHSKGNGSDQLRRAFIVSYQEARVPRNAYGDPADVLIPG